MKREKLTQVFSDDEIVELEQLLHDRADRARGRAVIDMRFVRALREEEREDAAPWWKCRDVYIEDWRAKWEKKETERTEIIGSHYDDGLPEAICTPRAQLTPRAPVNKKPQSEPVLRLVALVLRRAAQWLERQ